jgi:hypothetical protein
LESSILSLGSESHKLEAVVKSAVLRRCCAWRLWAAAGGFGTCVLGLHNPSKGRGVPKKKPVPDLSKAPKAEAAKLAKKRGGCWKTEMRTAEVREAKLQMLEF